MTPLRILVLSDLHFEHRRDGGVPFVASLRSEGVDVLALAGDLCGGSGLAPTLSSLCARFPDVVYTFGNHELYGRGFDVVRGLLRDLGGKLPNLHVLDATSADVAGRRFLGATLWYPPGPGSSPDEPSMNDFRCIPGFRDRVGGENARAVAFLRESLQPGDVVLTHHLPSGGSVADCFRGSPLERFFVCPLDDLILERKPSLWIHGHAHLGCDHRIGATRIVCNPFGYFGFEENPGFRSDFLVEL